MLLEREPEFDLLNGFVDDLDETGGRVVLIRGEAGIGKSSLVTGFSQAREGDCRVLYGTCDDLFIPQPLGPFYDWARIEPTLEQALHDNDRSGLFSATIELLSRTDRPTVLIIEDTQWADEATLDAIRYLGRRIGQTNGLLLLTYRVGEVDLGHPLRAVIGDIPAHAMARIELHSLSLAGVEAVVAGTGLDPSQVLEATRGNPFLVTQVALAGVEGAQLSLQDSVMARVRKLSPAAQEMLKLFSVIPEPIDTEVALRLDGADEHRLAECEQRGLLDYGTDFVRFRHELIRRAIESAMSTSERLSKSRMALAMLPKDTHPSLLVHCSVELHDVETLMDVAPRSARQAMAMGSRRQAVEDFRAIGPYLDRYSDELRGPLLDDWAGLEFQLDEIPEAIRLNDAARAHYRDLGDRIGESAALARSAHCHEIAGQRLRAEELAREAIAVLGPDPDGAALARALEVNTYLQMMTSNVGSVPGLVEQTLEAGGPDIDPTLLVRSLNHRGVAANITHYPHGRASLEEARQRAESAGLWYEACRADVMHTWSATEFRDLTVALEHAQRAIRSAVAHDVPSVEHASKALYARILELRGRWDEAADLARELADSPEIDQMISLPVLGVIEARKGRPAASKLLAEARAMSSVAGEFQRLSSAAIASLEYGWITGREAIAPDEAQDIMESGLRVGLTWSAGLIGYWLWELGHLKVAPAGVAEPYALLIEGDVGAAAALLERHEMPYEHALALMHGERADQLAALEALEVLGASAVAARLRKRLRAEGVAVPRGRSWDTRRHAAGLTARQAEVLQLLDEGLTNVEIADRLFISLRTAENHVAAVMDKLDVATREQAVERARTEGLLRAAASPD